MVEVWSKVLTKEWWFGCFDFGQQHSSGLLPYLWQLEKMFRSSHLSLTSSLGVLYSSWGKHDLPGMYTLQLYWLLALLPLPICFASSFSLDFLGIRGAYLWLYRNKQTAAKLEPRSSIDLCYSPFLFVLVGASTPLSHSWSHTETSCYLAMLNWLFFWFVGQNNQ